MYRNAHVLIGRKTMPTLKDTLLQKIIDHIGNDVNYNLNQSRGIIRFDNGSKITSYSWSDKNYKKVRSYELSAVAIEEGTENPDEEFYIEINNRVGRLPHIKECWIATATNPDSPAHWLYERFIVSKNPQRHVYYSNTFDNPFLPDTYIKQLKEDLDPKLAKRLIYGEWIEISQDVIYHCYESQHNYIDKEYEVSRYAPVHITWDFNIGMGKPLSLCLFQYVNDTFHFFDEVVIEGADTRGSLEELDLRGLLDSNYRYIIHGDATGGSKSTTSILSDYDIIKKFFQNHPKALRFEMKVPRSNPPIRKRHNRVNAYMLNDAGQRRLFVYNKCKTLDKGFRLTALKKGGSYLEDDTPAYQHVTTAAGYGVVYCSDNLKQGQAKIRSQAR
jgi:hypothetical protein